MKVRDAIAKMGFYSPPLESRKGQEKLLLDFNESTVPPPAGVMQAMQDWVGSGACKEYPQGYQALEAKLAAYSGVASNQVMVTNGSDQALEVILRSLLEPGDEMVFARPGFAMIPHIAEVIGAVPVLVDYREDMAFPMEEMLDAVTPRTRLIVLINPNNPTGTPLTLTDVSRVLDENPEVPVLVDEAYFEFTGQSAAMLIESYENLVITRTFSKAFALAGLRLGYILSGAPFIRELHKVRGPFDVNMLAVVGGMAMLEHREQVSAYVTEVMEHAKPMVERFFEAQGVIFFKGAANFMLVRPKYLEGACAFLEARDILVRPQKPPVGDCFRLSIGKVEEMERFIQVYGEYLTSVENG